jgi:hypothetical protein
MTMNSPRGIYHMFGVFQNGECEGVEETLEDAKHVAIMLSQRDSAGKVKLPVAANRLIKPVIVLEANLNMHFMMGLKTELVECMKELRDAEKEEQKMMEAAVKEKSTMPNNYWHRKHKAFIKSEALKRLVEHFEQSSQEKFLNRA